MNRKRFNKVVSKIIIMTMVFNLGVHQKIFASELVDYTSGIEFNQSITTPGQINVTTSSAYQLGGRVYYIDSTSTVEEEDGTEKNPFKGFREINKTILQPGDQVLLRAGTYYTGQLHLEGKGTLDNPIIVGMYGEGTKPKINGNNTNGEGIVHIYNGSNIIVQDLEVFDSVKDEGNKRGVLIEGHNGGVLENITIRDLYIHDIEGYNDASGSGMSDESKLTGGIQAHVTAWSTPTRFDSLTIEGCTIEKVGNAGISLWHIADTKRGKVPPGNRYGQTITPNLPRLDEEGQIELDENGEFIIEDFIHPAWEDAKYTNLIIKDNIISNIAKNAIIARVSEGGLVEGNVVYETAVRSISGNQIFTKDCDGTVIQKNEGFLNKAIADDKGVTRDGSMLDPDLRSPNTIWQYNYSHDNAFGLMTNCTVSTDENVIVRYNMSRADKGYLMNINYDVGSMYIYNNTFYIPNNKEIKAEVIRERDKSFDSRKSNQTYYYYNNLVYNENPSTIFNFALEGKDTTDGKAISPIIYDTIERHFGNNLIYNKIGKELPEQFVLTQEEYKGLDGKNYPTRTATVDGGLLQEEPLLVNADDGGNIQGRTGRDTLDGFMLLEDSPALGAGTSMIQIVDNEVEISIVGEEDFFGNPVSSVSTNIGAYGGKGIVYDATIDLSQYEKIRFNDVEIIKDIKYGEAINYKGEKEDLSLDMYTGKGDIATNRPLMVIVHGGGFRTNDQTKEQGYIVRYAKEFAQRGYVVASIEYRRRDKEDMDEQTKELPALQDATEDLNTALTWLEKNYTTYGFNPGYTFLMGGSAGGRTVVSMSTYDNENQPKEDQPFTKTDLDYKNFLGNKSRIIATANLWGSPEEEMRWYTVDEKDIPMVIVHGDADTTVAYENSKYLANQLKEKDIPYEFYTIPGGAHTPTGQINDPKIIKWVSDFFIKEWKKRLDKEGILPEVKPNNYYSCEDGFGKPKFKDEIIGEGNIIEVRNHSDIAAYKEGYMKFNLGNIGIFKDITDARLTLYIESVLDGKGNAPSDPVNLEIYIGEDDNWIETDKTRLPSSSNLTLVGSMEVLEQGYYSLDITSFIQEHIDKDPYITLQVQSKAPVAYTFKIHSRENTKQPTLKVKAIDKEVITPPGPDIDPDPDPEMPENCYVPIADTMVRSGDYSTSNYGKATTIDAKSSLNKGFLRTPYMKFNLETILRPIEKAELNFYVSKRDKGNALNADTNLTIYGIEEDNWEEENLTWDNQPIMEEAQKTATIFIDKIGWYTVDITDFINQQMKKDRVVTLLLMDKECRTTNITINSKENGVNQPYLKVKLGEEIENADIPVSKIMLQEYLTLRRGENVNLTTNILPENATNKQVRWYSSDEKVALVDGDGLVKAIKPGVAFITVESAEGIKSNQCKIDITENSITSDGDEEIIGRPKIEKKQKIEQKKEVEKTLFVDIKGHWAEKEIIEVVKLGIFKGKSEDIFDPDGYLTRAEIAVICNRLLEGTNESVEIVASNSFTDIKEDTWYAESINNMVGLGVIKGYPDNTFKPNNKLTKTEYQILLQRVKGIRDKSINSDLITKKNMELITRAEVAVSINQFLKKVFIN